MQSPMKHRFSEVPKAEIQRSLMNRSCRHTTAFDASYLIPIFLDEALPGDTMNLKMTAFGRMATPIHPLMDNLFLESFFFFVPNRLVWDNWQKLCGEQVDPGDSIAYSVPVMNFGGVVALNSLSDYMGIPYKDCDGVSALFHRAYNLIWNEWFRSEDLQDSVTVDRGDAASAIADYVLLKRGKRHDYFTSCLPWAQKGDAVVLPLGTSAPVELGTTTGGQMFVRHASDLTLDTTSGALVSSTGSSGALADSAQDMVLDPNGLMEADLTSATAATINEIREAFQIQRLIERDARGGTRYTEIIKSHFGVTSPDARLQRPEYLGGGITTINVNPVPQTSETNVTDQGNMAAYGTVSVENHGFNKSFTEHGMIIGLVNVRGDITYSQGINRMFMRSTRYDFYWPALANIGEQAVLNQEIFFQDTSADTEVFGYIPRYDEYRHKPSLITGIMRPDAAGSLASWHLSEDFATLPVLDASFIVDATPLDRALATPAEPHIIFDSFFDLKHARPMPVQSVPGRMDHF